jgi:hypothetical protein
MRGARCGGASSHQLLYLIFDIHTPLVHMDFRPKHPQPFSLIDALKFDPATITEGSALLSSDDSSY